MAIDNSANYAILIDVTSEFAARLQRDLWVDGKITVTLSREDGTRLLAVASPHMQFKPTMEKLPTGTMMWMTVAGVRYEWQGDYDG